MTTFARWVIRNYLRLCGWYIDRHECAWSNTTATEDD